MPIYQIFLEKINHCMDLDNIFQKNAEILSNVWNECSSSRMG